MAGLKLPLNVLVGKVFGSLEKDPHVDNRKKKGKGLQVLVVVYARSQRHLGLGLGL